ncbi:ATP-dependent translocase ABCB1-like [Argiope bruennichi]|uniref:ATP-dependent translocase ABCB1-like n=1 Tax=Argiope bruennichi TaxID=94029 RepID=UPI002493F249|nr:ATP-dependent translocase ABCB1-like [Argiope bruennichi]
MVYFFSYGINEENRSEKKEKNKFSIWQLFRYSKKCDVYLMIIGSFSAFINGAGWPILAIVFGSMTDTFLTKSASEAPISISPNGTSIFGDEDMHPNQTNGNVTNDNFEESMKAFSLYYLYIGIGVFFASTIQITSWVLACERQVYTMRQHFFRQFLRHEISWFDKHQSGELTTKLNDDLERVREGIGDKFSMLIQYASTFLAGFIVGFIKGWQLTLVIMSMTPLLTLSSAYVGKRIATSSAREQKKYAIAGGLAEECLSNIKTVTMFNGQDGEIQRYKSALNEALKVAIRKYTVTGIAFGFTFFVLYASYALAFWYGGKLVSENKMTPGDVFSVIFSVMIGSFALGNAMPQLAAVATAYGAGSSVFKIINTIPKIDPYSKDGIQPREFSANIKFHDVNFSYPTRKTVQVLKNFSLLIREGQTVALCGPSGSGKSTIVNLILRFYDPVGGYVTLGDYNLKTLNVSWLRSKIGIVSQEPVLFSGSIAKNIKYGNENITFPDIVAAAKMANAHDFISKLPQGYDTLVGERGAQLSGGQKQRIAIARALVRDPRILLLDEATSALDAESEAIVQEALDKAQEGRTTVVIAHRLSTIRSADIICAMENGEIKEQGTHEELMERQGLYYQLVTNQVFTDDNAHRSSEEDHLNDAEKFLSLKRKRSSFRTVTHPELRQISSLQLDLEEEEVPIPSALQILKQSKSEWKEIAIGSLASIATGSIMPAYAVFYSEIFHTFTLSGDALKESTFFWSMMFLMLAMIATVGHVFRTIGYSFAGEKLTTRLRYQTFSNVLRQDIAWFDDYRHTSGKLASRLATDIPLMKSAGGLRIGTVISGVVTLLASITIAFVFGWKLALALILVVPILLSAGAMQMKISKGNQIRDAELMSLASEIASESIENIKTVQSLSLENRFYERYVSNLLTPFKENKKNSRLYALAYAFSQAIMFFAYAAAFRLGAFLVAKNDMEPVNVYRVFFAMAFSAVAVGQWTLYLPDYAKAKLSAGLVFHLMNLVPNIDSSSEGGMRPEVNGKIDFIDVKFRYPCRRNVQVLQGITLTINPGQTVALVGASGCGKSTLIALLERFYDPEIGKILLDGHDIKTINLKYLRSQMALVSQEPVLFNCTIKENITYGIEDKVTESDIEAVTRIANIHDFIINLPKGYDTVVGERGTQLSGGQKQRIAIARALIRHPKILLLDEATSALDTESEKAVQKALDQARQGRTCLIIAHRLSTIQNADCIAVIGNGKIVEKGTHQELVSKKGMYYELMKKQYK